MSDPPLPAPLRIPDISRFLNRANQLRAIKPAAAYWCEYHAVNQIVGKGLHNVDDECFNFTKSLIERLETTKAERADDDAVVDNDAGRAYIELFAQETFDRAERTMRAGKVTRQTADTFDAAATFFDLTREWTSPDSETVQKIKFAKWNAARILKAIRQGDDPNQSNPKPSDRQPDVALMPDDPDVQQILSSGPPAAPMEPASTAGMDEAALSRPPPPRGITDLSSGASASLSGSHPSQAPPIDQTAAGQEPSFMTAPPPTQYPYPAAPSFPSSSQPAADSFSLTDNSSMVSRPPPSAATSDEPVIHTARSLRNAPPPAAHPPPGAALAATSQKDLNEAQKHAKWAISALNFEDVPTAVTELRNALAKLGAL